MRKLTKEEQVSCVCMRGSKGDCLRGRTRGVAAYCLMQCDFQRSDELCADMNAFYASIAACRTRRCPS